MIPQEFQQSTVEDIVDPQTQAQVQLGAVSKFSHMNALLIGWVSVTWIISFLRFENVLRIPQERIQAAHSGGYLGCLRYSRSSADRGGCRSFPARTHLCVEQQVEATYCGPAGRLCCTTGRGGGPRWDHGFCPRSTLGERFLEQIDDFLDPLIWEKVVEVVRTFLPQFLFRVVFLGGGSFGCSLFVAVVLCMVSPR